MDKLLNASSLPKPNRQKSTEAFMLMRKSSKKASFISDSSVDNEDEPVEIMGKLFFSYIVPEPFL